MLLQIVIFYWIVINFVTFAVYGIDKRRAIKGRWRVREAVLFALALAGGALGALVGMYLFRHKTQKWYFCWGNAVILIVQTVLLYVLMRVLS